MAGHGEVWVYAEEDWDELKEIGIELLSKGRELADGLDVQLCSILIGSKVKKHADILFEHGADKVYVCDKPSLEHYDTVKYAKVIEVLVEKYKPNIVLYGASTQGRDLAPRIASKLRVGLTADCTDLLIGDYKHTDGNQFKNILYQIRPAFGGNIIATIVSPKHRPQMATVREGVMPIPPKRMPLPCGCHCLIPRSSRPDSVQELCVVQVPGIYNGKHCGARQISRIDNGIA